MLSHFCAVRRMSDLDDTLFPSLAIQVAAPDRVEFRLAARRIGQDRPANLLWLQRGADDPGMIISGNVGNCLVVGQWDPTDAVLALPVSAASVGPLTSWFDHAHAGSCRLTRTNAAAPRLRLPEGTAEGDQLWREDLTTLDEADPGQAAKVTIDPETGGVQSAPEQTPSQKGTFPAPDPVFQAIEIALAKGRLVSIDRVGRAPPLEMPVGAELFGEAHEERAGAARRKQAFTVSLFDEKTSKLLANRRGNLATRLAAFTLMLREGERWMPEAAVALFQSEIADADAKAAQALTEAVGGKTADEFVASQLDKVHADCLQLMRQFAPGRKPSPDLMNKVRDGLASRLAANLARGMGAGLSFSTVQLSSGDDGRNGPWGAIQTLLASAARLPREVITDRFRLQGLVVKPEPFIRVFDLSATRLSQRISMIDGWTSKPGTNSPRSTRSSATTSPPAGNAPTRFSGSLPAAVQCKRWPH